jgi:hypothetical protein
MNVTLTVEQVIALRKLALSASADPEAMATLKIFLDDAILIPTQTEVPPEVIPSPTQAQAKALAPGDTTSEHTAYLSADWWSMITTILGIVTLLGSAVLEVIGKDSKWGVIVGGVIAVVGQLSKTLGTNAFISSRTQVKAAALKGPSVGPPV